MRMMIDGRVLAHPNITGVERYAISITKAMGGLVDEITVAQPRTHSRLKQHIWEQFALPNLAEESGADILFCPANLGPLRVNGPYKQVLVLHSVSYLACPDSYSRFFRNYYKLVVPQAAAASSVVITVSEAERETILSYYPWLDGKLEVVQNGVDSIFSPNGTKRDGSILYVGSLSPGKNLAGVLKAYSLICSRIPQRLVVVGSCGDSFMSVPEIDSITKTIPPDRVEFVGHVNKPEELRDYYCRADCLLFPSLYEASPLPPIEAMACGTPIITSDIPALRERCQQAALYCDPNDPCDIAEKTMTLVTDPAVHGWLAEKSLEQAHAFSWYDTALRTLDICRSAL